MALPTSHNVVTAAQLGSTLSAYNTKLNERFKPKQDAVTDPTASGTTTTAIDTISQDADGKITVTKKTISGVAPKTHTHGNITNDGKVGSTADYAVVTTTGGAVTAISLATSAPSASGSALSFIDSVSQDSKGKITATKKSVTVDSTYSATGTNPVNGAAIAAAIGTLDVSAIEGAASKTITSISETDGKISATYSNIAIAESQVTNLTTDLAAKAPLASPALTGTPTAPTANAGTNTTQIATTAFVKTAVENGLATADALTYKGTISGSTATAAYGGLTVAANKGDVYKVTVAGKVDGVAVEVGDMIICNADSTAAATSSNYSTIAANWDFIQGNTEGVVIGPASAVDTCVAVFDGTTGKLIKDSGFTIAKSVPSNAVFTDTNTKVTSADNHYAPSTASGQDKSASASGATAAWGIDVVKGVTLNTDGKGHVTGISVTSGKIPSNPNTDTKVTQTLVASDNTSEYPILLAPTGQTATATTTANFVTGAKYKPSTNTLSVNISGNATTATSATSAASATTASNYATGGTIESALNGKAASNHTHTASLATDTGTSAITLASAGKYKLTAGGSSVIFTMPTIPSSANNGALKIGLNGGTATSKFTANQSGDSTITFATGSSNGTIAVDGTNVAVKGLGSAAYTASTAYATSGHTHTTSIATSTASSSLTLEVGGKYSISAGGTSYVFTNGTEMTDDEVTNLLAALT